jgi:hypothetical protein
MPHGNLNLRGSRKCSVEVTFNDMTSLSNFIKIFQLAQKLLGSIFHPPGDISSMEKSGGMISTGKTDSSPELCGNPTSTVI